MRDKGRLNSFLLFSIDEDGLWRRWLLVGYRATRLRSVSSMMRVLHWVTLGIIWLVRVLVYSVHGWWWRDVRFNDRRGSEAEKLQVIGIHGEGRDPLKLLFVKVERSNETIGRASIQCQAILGPKITINY